MIFATKLWFFYIYQIFHVDFFWNSAYFCGKNAPIAKQNASVVKQKEKSIERQVFDLLKEKGMTFASAESCTGGNIAHLITLIPGSSEVFRGGAVTYATPTKTKVLKVPKKTIDTDGVVSRRVVEAMAIGTRNLMEADFGVATTGVAGPSGGTDENPVGTVWIGVATPNGTVSERVNFGKGRRKVIRQATLEAYRLLYEAVKRC